MRQWRKTAAVFAAAAMVLAGCSTQSSAPSEAASQSAESSAKQEASSEASGKETMDLQILATSDLHGKFDPWDYALNEESKSGSMAQVASAVK